MTHVCSIIYNDKNFFGLNVFKKAIDRGVERKTLFEHIERKESETFKVHVKHEECISA